MQAHVCLDLICDQHSVSTVAWATSSPRSTSTLSCSRAWHTHGNLLWDEFLLSFQASLALQPQWVRILYKRTTQLVCCLCLLLSLEVFCRYFWTTTFDPSTGRSCTIVTCMELKAGWPKAMAKANLGQRTASVASALVLAMNFTALWGLPALPLPHEKGWDLGKAAVDGGRIGAPLIFSIFSQVTSGIIGSAHLSAPLGLHLGFVPSYLFPVAEADGLDQNSYGITIQFCLNFGCVGIEFWKVQAMGK